MCHLVTVPSWQSPNATRSRFGYLLVRAPRYRPSGSGMWSAARCMFARPMPVKRERNAVRGPLYVRPPGAS